MFGNYLHNNLEWPFAFIYVKHIVLPLCSIIMYVKHIVVYLCEAHWITTVYELCYINKIALPCHKWLVQAQGQEGTLSRSHGVLSFSYSQKYTALTGHYFLKDTQLRCTQEQHQMLKCFRCNVGLKQLHFTLLYYRKVEVYWRFSTWIWNCYQSQSIVTFCIIGDTIP